VLVATIDNLPTVWLVRHGETEWSLSGRHTGRTDVPLTKNGERRAALLGERLRARTFALVLTSPLQRAAHTCELAGFGDRRQLDPDLVEWDYGAYEGRRTVEIRTERPQWDLFRDGCPGGESPGDVAVRADRVLTRVRDVAGDALLFSSGHFLRVFAARWLDLEPEAGRFLYLDTASLSVLAYERDCSRPVVRLWNDAAAAGAFTD
jgi:broad specificity phosphatase PhoE